MTPARLGALALCAALAAPAVAGAQVRDLRIEGYLQADGRFYPGADGADIPSTWQIRRARVSVEGTVARYLTFLFIPDIGRGVASIAEATVGARFADELALRVGLTKPRIGLEASQRSSDLHLIERGLPAYILPNRDVGISLGGVVLDGAVSYDVGLFNGVPDYGTSNQDTGVEKDVAGRVFLTPFAAHGAVPTVNVGIGVGLSTGIEHGSSDLPLTSTLRSPGQVTIFEYRSGSPAEAVIADGRRSRIDPQAYLYAGPLGVMAEFARSHHRVRLGSAEATTTHKAWQVAGTLLLTGERAGFGPLVPRHELFPERGHWGAVEVAARIEGAEVGDDAFPVFADSGHAVRRATGVGVGLSWYFARRTKLVVEYERTTFRGGAAAGDRPVENFLAARLQVSR